MSDSEILQTNRAVRSWSAEVRTRSRAARHEARAALRPRPRSEPTLGDVAVSELFVILVDDHDLGVLDAVRALASGLALAGYPADFDRVAAADALDILHLALRRHG